MAHDIAGRGMMKKIDSKVGVKNFFNPTYCEKKSCISGIKANDESAIPVIGEIWLKMNGITSSVIKLFTGRGS
jgi:hypothetical protein